METKIPARKPPSTPLRLHAVWRFRLPLSGPRDPLRPWRRVACAIGALSVLGTVAPAAGQSPAQARPAPARSPGRIPSDATYFGGIQINEPDHQRWVNAVAAAGLNSVQVTLYARQQDWDGADLWYDREAPWVVAEIRAAHAAGLRVVLVMRVALEHALPRNRHLWHGMIWPREDALDAWFAAYRDFVAWGAAIAAAEGVELFAIGNELSSMTGTVPLTEWPDLYAYWADDARVAAVHRSLVQCADRIRDQGSGDDLVHLDGGRYASLGQMLEAEQIVRRRWVEAVMADGIDGLNRRRLRYLESWRELIAEVRESFSGAVTYGANFDQVLDVGFWADLDLIATTGYFPLAPYGLDPDARQSRMRASWREIAQQMTAAAPGKPVVFLELGWTRWLGSTVRPYSYDRVEVLETASGGLTCVHWATQPQSPGERVGALRALARVVAAGQFEQLRGFTLWKLTTRPEQRAIEPFAVLLDAEGRYDGIAWQSPADTSVDGLDRAFIATAAEIARQVHQRNNGAR